MERTNHMTMNDLLQITKSTSQRDLARKLGVTQNCVWGWVRRKRVSADGAIALEALTKGKLKAAALRQTELAVE